MKLGQTVNPSLFCIFNFKQKIYFRRPMNSIDFLEPSKQETLRQGWCNVGSMSQTVAQQTSKSFVNVPCLLFFGV